VKEERPPGIYLFWIPLGAGGSGFVRLNGRIYERLHARRHQRHPRALYHTALEVYPTKSARFVVETMWPQPDGNGEARGVVREGPVFAGWLSFTRVFRYEVRCWPNGSLPDAEAASGGPRPVSNDVAIADRLLALTEMVPSLTWGRDVSGVGDMWNSNSVISWLLARSGVEMSEIHAPDEGRAPGWEAGITVAQRTLVP
jgi:hypothetical protein